MRRVALTALLAALALPAIAAEWPPMKIDWKNPPKGKLDVRITIDAQESIKIGRGKVYSDSTYHEEIRAEIDVAAVQKAAFDTLAEDGSSYGKQEEAAIARMRASAPAATAESVGVMQQKMAECMVIEDSAKKQACVMAAAMSIRLKKPEEKRCTDPKGDVLCEGASGTPKPQDGTVPKDGPVVPGKSEGGTGKGGTASGNTPGAASNEDAYLIFMQKGCKVTGSFKYASSGVTEHDMGISPFTKSVINTDTKPVDSYICEARMVLGRDGTASVRVTIAGAGVVLPARSVMNVKSVGTLTDDRPVKVGNWASFKLGGMEVLKTPVESLAQFSLERSYDGSPLAMASTMNGSQTVRASSRSRVSWSFRAD